MKTPYTLTKAGLGLFSHYDALIVVDDWKGGTTGQDGSPVYFGARLYDLRDGGRLRILVEALLRFGAYDWHARARERRSLFASSGFSDVLSALDATGALLLGQHHRVSDILNPEHLTWAG